MKKQNKRILSFVLAMVMFCLSGVTALADRVDGEENQPYLALGADLSESDKTKVLELMGIDSSNLGQYFVTTVTNAEEHQYLGNYLDSSVIGTRALSSVLVVGKESGYGVKVSTHNISYCTTGMYRNALITAGIEDADVTVVGPMLISGTAALVGVTKAYEEMTGEKISEENLDAANNELIVTQEVTQNTGVDSEKIEELIALIKQLIVENDITSKEGIEDAIDKAADELDVTLSEEDRSLIRELMEKISSLDLNIDSLKNAAKDLYNKLDGLDIDISKEEAVGWITKIINAIADFFRGIFN